MERVWEELKGWHYLNPTRGASIWESPSGHTFYLAFDRHDRIEECVADPDEELDALCERLAHEFEILPVVDGSE